MNMRFTQRVLTLAIPAVCALAAPHTASAALELLTNGDFATGSFVGWTVTNLVTNLGNSGSWFIDAPGSTTPLSGFATSAAGGGPHGASYAVTDQIGPSTHALTQSFAVAPAAGSVFLHFDMFVNDWDGGPFCGPGLRK